MLTREQTEMIIWHSEPLHKVSIKLVNREEYVEAETDKSIKAYLERKDLNWDDLTLGEQNEMVWQHQCSNNMSFDGMCSYGSPYREDKEFKQNGPYYVTCISWSRCYGGPEEGGWYYTAPDLVKWCALPTYEMAEWLAKTLTEKAKEKKYEPQYSALGGDDSVNSVYPEGYIPTGWVGNREWEYQVSHEVVRPDFQRPHYE